MKAPPAKVLVVDDDDNILYAFQQVLVKDGYESFVARNGEEALVMISLENPIVVFMDITMPKLDGLEALKKIRQLNRSIPVVIITGLGTMQKAIKAMQLGAFEYLTKPLDVDKIRDVTRRAVMSWQGGTALVRGVSLTTNIVRRYEIVGNSSAMQDVYKLIGSISTTPNHTSVLILGESGTGKELVARAIHANSENAGEPFIPINCAAFPETLLESELFGHEKGTFTGAIERKIGKFEIAERGSIFLDEIGNLTPNLQQKLLRVLQEREFERLGGNELIHVGARFLAATNSDIVARVKEGKFREDLFYRLNVVTLRLPPLRERKDDIPILTSYFLQKYNAQLNRFVSGFSSEAMALLQSYSFPGNVRELENLVERAVMVTHGDLILPHAIGELSHPTTDVSVPLPISSPVFGQARDTLLGMFERQFLIHQLAKHRGNVTAAAEESKMTRQNFQRLLKKHGIRAQQFRK